MSDFLTCPPATFGPGISSQIMLSLRIGKNNILRNSFNNDLAVNNGNIRYEDESLGYIRIDSTGGTGGAGVGADSYIRVETCFKNPCSDLNNHLDTLIISDMVTKSFDYTVRCI